MASQCQSFPPLPLDILHRVAEIIAYKPPADPSDMRNFSLVNRDFSAAFHPLVFYYTDIHPHDYLVVKKRLGILSSNPQICSAVRDLHVTMAAPEADGFDDVRELLSSFTNLKSLRVSGPNTYPNVVAEEWRNWPLATSIERLCKLPTLESLVCFYLGRIPASWFIFSNSLTSVLLARTWPSLDIDPAQNDAASVRFGPSNPNRTNESTLREVSSRIRSLSATTSLGHGINAAFNKFVSVVGAMSQIEDFNMIMEDISSTRLFSEAFYEADMLFPSLENLRFLRSFALDCINNASMFLHAFVSTLPRTIASLDTAFLRRFHLSFGHVQTRELESLLHMFSAAEGSLNGIFANKLARRELDELEEVEVRIQVDIYIIGHIPRVMEQVQVFKETPFLPSLPQEKLRVVVLKEFCSNNRNELLYDSKGPM